MHDFRKLDVWERSHKLTLLIYGVTKAFPNSERFGITSQLRRCSASIPANIAEGCGRFTSSEMARFLHIAMGSASELHYHLILSRDLQLMTQDQTHELLHEVMDVKRMLSSLIKRVRPPSPAVPTSQSSAPRQNRQL